MKKIKTYDSFMSESVKDLMKPKSNEEVLVELDKLPPYEALMKVNRYDMKEVKANVLKRVEEVNKQLYVDIKRFNRTNMNEIMKFVSDWIDDNGGDHRILKCFDDILDNFSFSSDDDINEKYKINNRFKLNEDEEEEEYEENDSVFHIANKISDKTIENFKQLLVSYTIDILSNSKEKYEEEEEGYAEQ